MLRAAPIHPTIPVSNIDRSREFYERVLMLERDQDLPGLYFKAGAGTRFSLYETPHAGTAQHTLAAFTVRDIENEVAELRSRGVTFEEYDYGDFRTIDGIALLGSVRAAWFTDPDGNILALVENVLG